MKIMKNSSFSHFYFLNGFVLIFYLLITFNLKIDVSEEIFFSTPDSKTYLEVANWISGGENTDSIAIRPILYPLILLVLKEIGGVDALFFFHTILWFFIINYTFLTVKRLTKKIVFAYLGAFIVASNLSLISMTYHGLTEVWTAFLLTVLLYFIVKYKKAYKSLDFIQGILLVLVLLTITKPVFQIPLYIFLFIILPVFYGKKLLKSIPKIVTLLVILIPLFIQLSIVNKKSGNITVSTIKTKALVNYFIPQGIIQIESIDRKQALIKAKSLTVGERNTFIFSNKRKYFTLFFLNIKNNIKGYPTFLNYPKGYSQKTFSNYMLSMNNIIYGLHLIFIFPILFMIYDFFKERKTQETIISIILSLLLWYYLITTGVSYWQGDRLVLPSISIWACLYPFTMFYFWDIYVSGSFKKRVILMLENYT